MTSKCLNCGKEIETFKMVLHERFCSLNVRKCSICEEPVQIDEYNEHKNLKHTEMKCEQCGKKFPPQEYNSHLKTCSKKLMECQYCGLFLDQNELRDHEYQCGSKSKECDYCGMNVPIMEYELHLEYACKVKQLFNTNSNPDSNPNINDNPNPDFNSNTNPDFNTNTNYNTNSNIDDFPKDFEDIEKNVFQENEIEKEKENGKKNKLNTNKSKSKRTRRKAIKNDDWVYEKKGKNSHNFRFNLIDKNVGEHSNKKEEANALDFEDESHEPGNTHEKEKEKINFEKESWFPSGGHVKFSDNYSVSYNIVSSKEALQKKMDKSMERSSSNEKNKSKDN